ncbi:TPA: hypothetical protein ACYSZD_002332, partial [Streptococcus suis]
LHPRRSRKIPTIQMGSVGGLVMIRVVSCYDCDWRNGYEEWEFTPTGCPVCDGDVELEEFEEAEDL